MAANNPRCGIGGTEPVAVPAKDADITWRARPHWCLRRLPCAPFCLPGFQSVHTRSVSALFPLATVVDLFLPPPTARALVGREVAGTVAEVLCVVYTFRCVLPLSANRGSQQRKQRRSREWTLSRLGLNHLRPVTRIRHQYGKKLTATRTTLEVYQLSQSALSFSGVYLLFRRAKPC